MDYNKVKQDLIRKDPKLEPILNAYQPEYKNTNVSDYVRLIEIIIGQQLSGAAADTIFSRLTKILGQDFLPHQFLEINNKQFAEIGISKAKKNYCRLISEHAVDEPTYFTWLRNLLPTDQMHELMKFKGVGIWTASIFVMSSDIMSDIFAYGDVTLNRVIKQTYKLDEVQLDEQIDLILDNWSPYKTIVCKALWNYNDTILNQTLKRI